MILCCFFQIKNLHSSPNIFQKHLLNNQAKQHRKKYCLRAFFWMVIVQEVIDNSVQYFSALFRILSTGSKCSTVNNITITYCAVVKFHLSGYHSFIWSQPQTSVGNTLHRKTHNGKALLNIFHLHVHLSSFSVLCAQRARKLFAPNKTRGHGCLFLLDLWRSPFLVAQFGKRPYRGLKIFAFSRQFQENQTNVWSQNLELHYTVSFNTTQPVAHFLSLPS